jgi:hypothetical protein
VEEPRQTETVPCVQCLECERRWVDNTEHWRAYLDDEGGLLLYCPACASREFDS